MKKNKGFEILEVPCYINGCNKIAMVSLSDFFPTENQARQAKLDYLKHMINKLKLEHERGEHAEGYHSCCHCPCEHYACSKLAP